MFFLTKTWFIWLSWSIQTPSNVFHFIASLGKLKINRSKVVSSLTLLIKRQLLYSLSLLGVKWSLSRLDCAGDEMRSQRYATSSHQPWAWAESQTNRQVRQYKSNCNLASLYEQLILPERIWTNDLRGCAPNNGYYRIKPEGRCVTLHVQCSEPVTNGLLPSSKFVFAWTAEQPLKAISLCLFMDIHNLASSSFVYLGGGRMSRSPSWRGSRAYCLLLVRRAS